MNQEYIKWAAAWANQFRQIGGVDIEWSLLKDEFPKLQDNDEVFFNQQYQILKYKTMNGIKSNAVFNPKNQFKKKKRRH